MIRLSKRELRRRASGLKLLALDVDGVITEGELILIGGDVEAKRFNFHDGLGIVLLKSVGLRVALMSDRESPALSRRAAEMGIDNVASVILGDKGASLESLLGEMQVEPEETAFVGDDLRDVRAMRRVGMPLAVANARPEVKEYSVHVTRAPGGHGAVREVAEWLLELRGQKELAIASIIGTREGQPALPEEISAYATHAANGKGPAKLLRSFLPMTRSRARMMGGASYDEKKATTP